MDMRELKALELAARAKIVANDDGTWSVPSQGKPGSSYRVVTWPGAESCQCEDYQLRREPCKHVIAARLVEEREGKRPAPPMDTAEVPKRKTYRQDWPKYNLAQTTEKDRFQELLAELCAGVEEPARSVKAGKRVRLGDRIFAAAFKVFSTFSGRRFMSDLRQAHRKGYIRRMMTSGSIADFIDSDELTGPLYQLIERSALPLRSVETTFAPDSTGFSTSRFVRWFDEKYGQERSGREWVKCHAMVGTKTNVVTTAIVDGPTANDCPLFRPMLERTLAGGFDVQKVCADKGYLSKENLELAAKHGAAAFIPFKSNSVPGEAGTLWDRMFGYFQFHRADFLAHYHARSNVESTFSMVKAKFRDHVRSKTDVAMKNEVLLKLLCHNVVVVHQATIELGIDGTFWPDSGQPRDVLRFCPNQTAAVGITR
ncbi:MAG TPA: transposase [Gemmataceae bacterium]|jgi:transposase